MVYRSAFNILVKDWGILICADGIRGGKHIDGVHGEIGPKVIKYYCGGFNDNTT